MDIKEKTITILKEALEDERLYYPTADVFTNAPLALIQCSLESRVHTCQTILELPLTNFNKERKTKNKR